jgi:hypothetical protein
LRWNNRKIQDHGNPESMSSIEEQWLSITPDADQYSPFFSERGGIEFSPGLEPSEIPRRMK